MCEGRTSREPLSLGERDGLMVRSVSEVGFEREVDALNSWCGTALTCVAEMARPRLPKTGSTNL